MQVRILKGVLGVFCLLFGLFALVTPFTPGSWLVFVGLELLGLTFLIPRPVRGYWEKFRDELLRRFHAWRNRKK